MNHDSPDRDQCCAVDHFLIQTSPPPGIGPCSIQIGSGALESELPGTTVRRLEVQRV